MYGSKEAIKEVNQKMGVQLRVYITPDKGVEAAINPLTKSVFITEALSRLPTPQIKAVLAHEAHHAKQPLIKHVVSTLATAISILYKFTPFETNRKLKRRP